MSMTTIESVIVYHTRAEPFESKYNFESIGRLYSAGKCESPDQSLIDSCKEEAGLVDYPHIYIFMQRL